MVPVPPVKPVPMATGPASALPGTSSPVAIEKPIAAATEKAPRPTANSAPAPMDKPDTLGSATASLPGAKGTEAATQVAALPVGAPSAPSVPRAPPVLDPSKATVQASPLAVRGAPPPGSPGGPLVMLASPDNGLAGGRRPSPYATDAGRAPVPPSRLVDAAVGATVRLLASRGGGAVAEIGGGVLVDGRGYVLTPDRLLGESQALQVRLTDGRRLPVQRAWRDPLAGVAVLKIDGGGFPALAMGDSAALRVGDMATIVGGTAGVSSPAQATIRATGWATGGNLVIDLPVPGDRVGSPMIDQSGRMVGIATTDEASPSGAAIPIDRTKPVLRQAVAADSARHPAARVAPSPSGPGFR